MVRRASLTARLLTGYAVTVVVVLIGLGLLLDRTLQSTFLRDLTSSLRGQAVAVRAALPLDDAGLQSAVRDLGDQLGLRITVIRSDGVVLADSDRDPSTMENHARRREVRTALQGGTGVASRTSETTGRPYRYVAIPDGGRVTRVALPLSMVQERLAEVRRPIVAGTALAAILGVALVWVVARRVTRPLAQLTEAVADVPRGGRLDPIEVRGPAELALLSEALNRMTTELDSRIEEVRAGHREREAVLAAMEEGVIVVDAAGEVRYANPASERLLGTRPGDPGMPSSVALRSVVDAARRGRPAEAEVEIGIPPRTLRASAIALGDDALLVLRDVTAARRVEAMRREFVADASHELKTPAAAIRAAAETVESAVHDDPAAAARFARQLRHEAVRLSRIVADLLDLSRLESERPSTEAVRLDRVVEEELDRLRDQAAEAGVEVLWDPRPVSVQGSPKDLGLLVRNLIDNAIRYTPAGGDVRVAVANDAGPPTLTVEDTGIGIPTRDIPRIFERFYRVDRARSRDTGGTGLGLSIARHIAEQHGGAIEAISELGRGSTFRVTFAAQPATEG